MRASAKIDFIVGEVAAGRGDKYFKEPKECERRCRDCWVWEADGNPDSGVCGATGGLVWGRSDASECAGFARR